MDLDGTKDNVLMAGMWITEEVSGLLTDATVISTARKPATFFEDALAVCIAEVKNVTSSQMSHEQSVI